jgi:hypothetical protein
MPKRSLGPNIYWDSFSEIKHHLVLWLRVVGALPLLPLFTFMSWTGTPLPLHEYRHSLCLSLWIKRSASEGVLKDKRGITMRVDHLHKFWH